MNRVAYRPLLEALERRAMPSTLSLGTALPTVAATPTVPAVHHVAVAVHLSGSIIGTWGTERSVADVGQIQDLTGAGHVKPLGYVTAHGSLHMLGFIAQGHAHGTLTLSGAHGSLTLRLTGPVQRGFSPPPPTFAYTVTGGSGRYAGATGSGSVTFREMSVHDAVDSFVSPSFALTFHSR